MKAIILAAGMGTRLASVSGGLPKCMVQVGGRPIVDQQIERCGAAGISEIIIVTGFRAEVLREHIGNIDHPLAHNAVFVHNEHFDDMGNFYSLLVAEKAVGNSSFIKLDADLLIDDLVLPKILACNGPSVLAVDSKENMGDEEMKVRVDAAGKILEINKRMDPATALGESIGIDRFDSEVTGTVFAMLRKLIELGETDEYYERAYELLVQEGAAFEIADVTGCRWAEIDDAADLEAAHRIL